MAVTYDFQTPGVSTSAADTQEDIRNIAEMSWVWHVNASQHSLTNKPTGLIEAFYDSTVDFSVYPGGLANYGYQNYYSLKAFDGTNLGNVNFGELYVHNNGAVLSNTVGIRGREFISMGLFAGYACESSAVWSINADYGNSGTSTFDPVLSFYNQVTERARIYTDTSDSHKLKFDVGGDDRIVIDSSGNVGIGTSSPNHIVHIKETANSTTTANLILDSIVQYGYEAGTFEVRRQDYYVSSFGGVWEDNDNSYARIGIRHSGSTVYPLTIRDNMIGIGTSSPARKVTLYEASSNESFLHFANSTTGVNSTDGAHIGLDNNEDLQIALLESGKLIEFYNAGNQAMVIDSSGNVGIGTSSPSGKLDIALATENFAVVDAGSTSATEQDWIEVTVGGITGYIRVYATK